MKKQMAGVIILLLGIVQLSCNFPGAKPPTTTADLVNTAAALTVQALGTEMAPANPPTSIPPQAGTAPPTMAISATAPPLIGTSTASPNGTSCDAATFDADLTIPDGIVLPPNTHFTKIWRIKNTGSCTWNDTYSVVFKEGNAMSGTPSFTLQDSQVAAGETTNISIDLVAPGSAGKHRSVWTLRNNKGQTFGKFWVEINVRTDAVDEFAFVDNMCIAEWRGGSETLECPGDINNEAGYAIRDAAPKFEGGYIDDEPAMIMSPPRSGSSAEIRGTFLPVTVPAGAHFRTVVGCLDQSTGCDVKLSVLYRLEGGQEVPLGEWTETHDGSYQSIDIALDPLGLADKEVVFIFLVRANQTDKEHIAFWLRPAISK
jgi:hypothetical protein